MSEFDNRVVLITGAMNTEGNRQASPGAEIDGDAIPVYGRFSGNKRCPAGLL